MKMAHRSEMKTNSKTKTPVQSQRDCVHQPRVVRNELPREISPVHNPNGVAATNVVPLACAATLSGLKILQTHFPRVARYSQPWALFRNPFGIRVGSGARAFFTRFPSLHFLPLKSHEN